MTTIAARLRARPVWQVSPVLIGVGLLAGATAAGIGGLSLADALTATGLPDPGPVTAYGLPFVRAAGEIAAVVAVGSFLCAAFLVPPQTSGVLDAAGYRVYDAIMGAFTAFLAAKGSGRPTAIAAHTVLGKGVSFMEDDPKWHHGALSEEQLEQALVELGVAEPLAEPGDLFASA